MTEGSMMRSMWPFQKRPPEAAVAARGFGSLDIADSEITFVTLDKEDKVLGINVLGTPGQDCRLARRGNYDTGADVTLRFAGQRPPSNVTIVIDALERGTVKVNVFGSDSNLEIADSKMMNATVNLGENCHVKLGSQTTAGHVTLNAKGGSIDIGRDCMISAQVHIDAAHNHALIDLAGDAPAVVDTVPSVSVGDHVWIGHRVSLLGKCQIGAGSVIGAGAVVAGMVPDNAIAIGNPARVIKENMTWSRNPDGIDPMSQAYIDKLSDLAVTAAPHSDEAASSDAFSQGESR